jgi:ferredoxin-NADP reductase
MSLATNTPMEFINKKHEKGDVYSFHFRPLRKLPHKAGQHGFLSVPGARLFKPFSLASAPEDNEVVIGTHVHAHSKYKQALDHLEPGDTVKLRGPAFNFTIKKNATQLVFLAQGIGITPFRSILRHINIKRLDIETTLIHVEKDGHVFGNETRQLASHAYYPDKSQEFKKQLQKTLLEQPDATYYISGANSFLKTTVAELAEAGIKKSNMRRDKFVGYK